MYDKSLDYINGWNDALKPIMNMIEIQRRDGCFSVRPGTAMEKALIAKVDQLHNLVNNLMDKYAIYDDNL